MENQSQDQSTYQDFKQGVFDAILEATHKIPRWLQQGNSPSLSERPVTEKTLRLDALEGEGTALHTVTGRPPFRMRTYKQVKRRLAEMEELHEWIEKKVENQEDLEGTEEGQFLDSLEQVLNDMVE